MSLQVSRLTKNRYLSLMSVKTQARTHTHTHTHARTHIHTQTLYLEDKQHQQSSSSSNETYVLVRVGESGQMGRGAVNTHGSSQRPSVVL